MKKREFRVKEGNSRGSERERGENEGEDGPPRRTQRKFQMETSWVGTTHKGLSQTQGIMSM